MKHLSFRLFCTVVVLCTFFTGGLQAQCPAFNTLYVDGSVATSTGNGSSWSNAYRELGQALNVAGTCTNITTINVAKGTYRSAPVNSGLRDSAFTLLRGGLKIFGGYPSGGGVRNVATNPTILSGDLGTQNNTSDNSYHVVVIAGVGTSADSLVLDGFTITGGNANTISDKKYNGLDVGRSGGGGMTMVANNSGKIAVRNCTFTNNYALRNGGGISIAYSSPNIRGCSFSNCTGTEKGGGMFTDGAYPIINNSNFTGNSSKQGAGIYANSSSYSIQNCVFSGNNSSVEGGAMFNYNSTNGAGINNCSFSGNSSSQEGGGVYNYNSSPTIFSCVFSGNSSTNKGGGGMYNAYASSPSIFNCFFSGNSAKNNGGGVFNFSSSSPEITNCVFEGNNSGRDGGGMCNNFSSSPSLINCTFYGNTSVNSGGFMYNTDNSSPVITNCIIRSNTPLTPAIVNLTGSNATVTYSLIQGGYPGTGNANANALFVNSADPNGPDNVFGTADDGLALQPCSPAVNAGNNSVVQYIYIDVTGAGRIQAAKVDMGAYETAPLPGEAVLAGTIGNPHSIPYHQEDKNDFISSVTAPSSLATISWQKSTTGGSNWVAATPAGNQPTYKIPEILAATLFRRVATVCDLPYYSNAVEIKVVYPNGVINGRVSSINGTGIEGVQMKVTRTSSVSGGPAGFSYTALTGADGRYSVNPVYYGDRDTGSATFTVKPFKAGHVFNIDSINKTLNYAAPQATADFTDNTALIIAGRTYQQCTTCNSITGTIQTQTCPIDSVSIYKAENGDTLKYTTTTNFIDTAYGRYAIGITNPGVVRIQARYPGHSFAPAYTDVQASNSVSGVDFNDTTTHVISGKFGAGCNEYIGIAALEFTDVLSNDAAGNPRLSCFRKRINTTAAGTYSIRLPARKYSVKLVSFTPSGTSGLVADTVINFFNTRVSKDSLTRDIISRDTTLNIVYIRPPVIGVTGLNTVCTTPTPFALIRQNAIDSFKVFVYQGATTCPLSDTNSFKIVTNVQQEDQMEEFMYALADTGSKVKLKGGIPKIVGDHLKDLYIYFTDKYGRTATAFSSKVLVTGVKADEATFTTVSPELPMVILHDPPGDASYSTWQQSKSITNAVRFYTASALGGEAWLEAKIGAATTVGVGVLTDISAWGIIRGTIGINATTTSSNEAILTTTTTQNFSTSGNPDVIGQGGDVYVGAALNLIYATATDIGFSGCGNITSDRRLIIANSGFATQYIYSEDFIVNTLIPNLQSLAQLSPDSAARYLNQVKVWQQVVANNAENKRRAAFVENKSFDGSAGAYTNTTTTSSSKTSTIEFSTEFNASIAAELGFEVGGNGVSGGVTVNFKMETGESESNTTTDETTISYTLDDNTPGDFFSVNVKKDPVYNTPVFELAAGTASCPAEPGAQPRDDMYVTAVNPVVQNVPGSDYANFTLKIYNTSQSNETRTYRLAYDQGTNIANESVRIAGTDYTGTPVMLPSLAYKDSATVIVSIKRLPGSSVFSYEGERFWVMDNCDGSVSKSVLVSAYYVSPCSNITFTQPTNGWLINSNNGNTVFIQPAGYNPATLTSVNLQYSTGNGTNWTDGPFLTPAQLASGYNWSVAGLPDGIYNIRLRLDCSGGVIYSQRATGIIDRKAPVLYGRPEPTDDNYVTGDVIAFTYTENLNTNPDSVQVTVRRLSNGQLLPATVSVSENRLVITPTGSIAGFTGDSIRVIVLRVTDDYGNRKTTHDTLRFVIGATVVGTGNQALTLSITNPTVYKNGDSTINVFFNLPVNAINSTRVNYTISGTARYGIDYKVTYTSSDALFSSFNGSTGVIKIEGGSKQAVLKIIPIGGDTSLSPDKTVIISLAEGGDYSIGVTPSVTGKISSEDGIITYVFTGDGNWNIKNNWQNGNMPLTTLVAPKEIIVNPSGIARLNVAQTIRPGAKITVKQNRQMVIQGSLKQQ